MCNDFRLLLELSWVKSAWTAHLSYNINGINGLSRLIIKSRGGNVWHDLWTHTSPTWNKWARVDCKLVLGQRGRPALTWLINASGSGWHIESYTLNKTWIWLTNTNYHITREANMNPTRNKRVRVECKHVLGQSGSTHFDMINKWPY